MWKEIAKIWKERRRSPAAEHDPAPFPISTCCRLAFLHLLGAPSGLA
jgi:hypothetical protein